MAHSGFFFELENSTGNCKSIPARLPSDEEIEKAKNIFSKMTSIIVINGRF